MGGFNANYITYKLTEHDFPSKISVSVKEQSTRFIYLIEMKHTIIILSQPNFYLKENQSVKIILFEFFYKQ